MKKLLFLLTILPFTGNGKDYFQQDVEYRIEVKLDDIKHELHGFETVKYRNNSPDTLSFIYFHLWPNAYSKKNTALGKQLTESGKLEFHFADEKDRGFIDSLNFMIDGKAVKVEPDPEHVDICKLILDQPLKPGGEITITTPFHVKIPSANFSRLGHIGQSYQISQWYPKPAVYDRNGWNQMPYLNQGEFYSEYGKFDVFITLPKNYVVGATGDLVNGEKELAWLEEKVQATIARNGSFDKKDLKFPPSDSELKTLHYHQENVHDFAWFADKRYHVLKGEVTLPHSKRKVTTWTMFTNAEATLWTKSIEYMNDAIYYYSLWNGDYPYNHATAVDGTLSAGAGMEYPNVTVIGTSGNAFALEIVIVHEVGHNWFYGILGSNERVHPWMDEGLNSFNELRYVKTKYPDRKLIGDAAGGAAKTFDFAHLKQKAQYELSYIVNARRNLDQPIEYPAHEYTELNYGGIVYSKTAIVFDYLRAYLGNDAFDKAMKAYYEEWKFKHPMPEDLRRSIESSTGKNLDWFFNDLINTTKKVDYKICKAYHSERGNPEVVIKNKGDISSPVQICGIKDGKMRASIWYDMENSVGKKATLSLPPGQYDKIVIDYPGEMPEINRKNNRYKMNGMFRKTEPLRLQFIGSVENPERTQLYFAPIGGWNKYDKGMAGIALYNHFFPERKFQYTLAPMYGFGSKTVTGFASVSQTFYPEALFQNVRVSISGRRFSTAAYPNSGISSGIYSKVSPELSFELKKGRMRSDVTQQIHVREVMVTESFLYTPDATSIRLGPYDTRIAQASYLMNNKRKLHPYGFSLTIENSHTQGSRYTKLMSSFDYFINYGPKKNKGVEFRLFGGHMFSAPADLRFMFGFGYPAGYFDYTFDHLYLGRYETTGFLAQQWVEKDAGFIHPTAASLRNTTSASLKVKASVPVKLPINLYANTGYGNNVNEVLFESGASFSIVRNICEVYFPIYQTHPVNTLSYGEKIRFTLNLHLANPFNLARDFNM